MSNLLDCFESQLDQDAICTQEARTENNLLTLSDSDVYYKGLINYTLDLEEHLQWGRDTLCRGVNLMKVTKTAYDTETNEDHYKVEIETDSELFKKLLRESRERILKQHKNERSRRDTSNK